jgi:hypothetical protein
VWQVKKIPPFSESTSLSSNSQKLFTDIILGQINLLYILASHILKIHFNIIGVCLHLASDLFPSGLSSYIKTTCLTNFILLDLIALTKKLKSTNHEPPQYVNLSSPFYFSFGSKYLPQHFIFNYPQSTFLPQSLIFT